MSSFPEGEGWWYAADGRWYPPEQATRLTVTSIGSPRVHLFRALLCTILGLGLGLGIGLVVDDNGLAEATQIVGLIHSGTIEPTGPPTPSTYTDTGATIIIGDGAPTPIPVDPTATDPTATVPAPTDPAASPVPPPAVTEATAPPAPTEASCLAALATPEITAPFRDCTTEQYARLQPLVAPGKPALFAACGFQYMGPACDPIPVTTTTTIPAPTTGP